MRPDLAIFSTAKYSILFKSITRDSWAVSGEYINSFKMYLH